MLTTVEWWRVAEYTITQRNKTIRFLENIWKSEIPNSECEMMRIPQRIRKSKTHNLLKKHAQTSNSKPDTMLKKQKRINFKKKFKATEHRTEQWYVF